MAEPCVQRVAATDGEQFDAAFVDETAAAIVRPELRNPFRQPFFGVERWTTSTFLGMTEIAGTEAAAATAKRQVVHDLFQMFMPIRISHHGLLSNYHDVRFGGVLCMDCHRRFFIAFRLTYFV
jgi:hypothetical protein